VQLCNVTQAPDAPRPVRTPFLGQGIFDVGGLVRHLSAHGFVGFFEFEIFPPHLAGRGVEEIIAAAVRDFAAYSG
jgi:sugar phosphate isomerase/epimerase